MTVLLSVRLLCGLLALLWDYLLLAFFSERCICRKAAMIGYGLLAAVTVSCCYLGHPILYQILLLGGGYSLLSLDYEMKNRWRIVSGLASCFLQCLQLTALYFGSGRSWILGCFLFWIACYLSFILRLLQIRAFVRRKPLFWVSAALLVIGIPVIYAGLLSSVKTQGMLLFFFHLLLCIGILIFVLLLQLEQALNGQQLLENQKLQLSVYRQQLELIQDSQTQLQKIRHDLHNHMAVIEMLSDSAAAQYAQSLEQMLPASSLPVLPGNPALHAVLSCKLSQAQQKGVPIQASFIVPDQTAVAPIDFCIILGNLIDNAVRANLECISCGKEPFLSLRMRFKYGVWDICLQNPVCGHLIPDKTGKLFLSTKENPFEHGVGLQNVKAAVARYGGQFTPQAKDGVFTARVFLYEPKTAGTRR